MVARDHAPTTSAATPASPCAGHKERPILFSGPMVRALLDGRKTQTRRGLTRNNSTVLGDRWGAKSPWVGLDFTVAKPRTQSSLMLCIAGGDAPRDIHLDVPFLHPEDAARGMEWDGTVYRVRPQWEAGDRLWVREAWCAADAPGGFAYMADHPGDPRGLGWRPSIHMPRAASRITLEITDVRVERLQDISEADAKAEGAGLYVPGHGFITEAELRADPGYSNFLSPRLGFEAIWREINGDGSWDANPWVWAVAFRVLDALSTAPQVEGDRSRDEPSSPDTRGQTHG